MKKKIWKPRMKCTTSRIFPVPNEGWTWTKHRKFGQWLSRELLAMFQWAVQNSEVYLYSKDQAKYPQNIQPVVYKISSRIYYCRRARATVARSWWRRRGAVSWPPAARRRGWRACTGPPPRCGGWPPSTRCWPTGPGPWTRRTSRSSPRGRTAGPWQKSSKQLVSVGLERKFARHVFRENFAKLEKIATFELYKVGPGPDLTL